MQKYRENMEEEKKQVKMREAEMTRVMEEYKQMHTKKQRSQSKQKHQERIVWRSSINTAEGVSKKRH